MSIEFAVGRQVVCIDDWICPDARGKFETPLNGCVYTIREFDEDFQGTLTIRLVELHNPKCRFIEGTVEPAFPATSFRPVRETSIECFTKLLETPPVREKEPAL